MNNFAITLLMYVSIVSVLPILFGMLYSAAKPRKNIVLGVTLPFEARNDPQVEEICRDYKKRLIICTLVVFAVSFGSFFFQHFSFVMSWLMMWVILCIFIPYIPYILSYRRLKALKAERGWESPAAGEVLIDLETAAQLERKINPWWFFVPFAISLIPVAATLMQGRDWEPILAYGSCALTILMFYGIYRLIYRQRAEVVGEDANINRALTQARRYNWAKCWLLLAWLTGAFNLCLWIFVESVTGVMIVSCVYTFLVIAVVVSAEFKTRKAQHDLARDSGKGLYADEDRYWILGMFYYNPHDRHVMINDRIGIGMSANYARPTGKLLLALSIAAILSLPVICVWMIHLESTPVRIAIEDNRVSAYHTKLIYSIAFDEIESAALLEELGKTHKLNGTGMDTVYTGRFRVEDEGACYLCLNPQSQLFILIKTAERTYILGGDASQQTQEAYTALLDAGVKANR